MFLSLRAKLALTLVALLLPIGLVFILSTLYTSQRYYQELTQKFSRDLALGIVQTDDIMLGDTVDTDKLNDLVKMSAMTNPGVELYVLDEQGQVIGASVDVSTLAQGIVDLEPIERFISEQDNFPILGTDPQQSRGRKIFSAAPLLENQRVMGYMYVLLADAQRDSVVKTARNSVVLSLSLWLTVAMLSLVLIAGMLFFNILTRRLRRLTLAMSNFKAEAYKHPVQLSVSAQPRDEVDELEAVYSDMASRISQQVQAMQQADVLRRELMTNVSHDLRTPLASIQGYLETLLIKDDLDANQQRRYLEIASKQSQRLSKLVAELLELSKLESNQVHAHPEAFMLSELVHDVVQKFQLVAEHRTVQLEMNSVASLPFVCADIGMIERVLSNLIDNAIRYTPAGGTVTVSLKQRHSGEVTVSVRDTGRGIPAEDIPFIFDRFYRASKSDPREGSGLGLAISQRMMRLHEQEITVNSQVGKGSLFRFALPITGCQ